MLSRSGRIGVLATVLACVGSIGAGAYGQAATGADQPKPALKGPEVKDREVPGVRDRFAEGEAGKFMQRERMPLPVFVDALKVLTATDAPADIRATPQQEETVRGLVEKFNQERRDYMASHKDEIRKLRGDGAPLPGEARRPGNKK